MIFERNIIKKLVKGI